MGLSSGRLIILLFKKPIVDCPNLRVNVIFRFFCHIRVSFMVDFSLRCHLCFGWLWVRHHLRQLGLFQLKLGGIKNLASILVQLEPATRANANVRKRRSAERSKIHLSLAITRIDVVHLVDEHFDGDQIVSFATTDITVLKRFFDCLSTNFVRRYTRIFRRLLFLCDGDSDWNANSSVPLRIVLVFLGCVWCPVLLPLTGYTDVALREQRQWLTCQLSFLYRQL